MRIAIIVIGIIIILGISWLIISANKKDKIKTKAISLGVPTNIATSIAQSSTPEQTARLAGIPEATIISIMS